MSKNLYNIVSVCECACVSVYVYTVYYTVIHDVKCESDFCVFCERNIYSLNSTPSYSFYYIRMELLCVQRRPMNNFGGKTLTYMHLNILFGCQLIFNSYSSELLSFNHD